VKVKTALIVLMTGTVWGAPDILPTPHYMEPLNRQIPGPFSVQVAQASSKADLAADMLRKQLPQGSGGATVHLWDYSVNPNPPAKLNFLDRETLSNPAYWGQSYVLTYPDEKSVWVIGASPQGIVWGAASLLQLADNGGVTAAYIRDYPDFEFRAASDWLLNIEINGWALDRGQGFDAFARTVETKLDRAARYKINMVFMDGFGFSLSRRPPEYGDLMRRLNRYARARGIHLSFGGYGASYGMAYEPVVMYQNGSGFKGTVFENRRSYPNGEIYRCMGFPKSRKGYDPATLGSCRSNEALNHLKAEELADFVRQVEPGALYIHHEDFGGFDGTQDAWLHRCEDCRRKWPNDSLIAPDGGAGGLAHGYSALIRGVNTVRNPESGYDASRDCQIILVSPVYAPSGPTSEDWSNALELWRNIGKQLPPAPNVQACFREVLPLRNGGERWTERFASVMASAGLNLNTFLFFAGGADRFVTDYPLTGTPVMNALFIGARGIYNASGDFYQEPMELINAEYSWNVRSTGFSRVPATYQEGTQLLGRYAYKKNEPPEVFGSGELYERVCKMLYGAKAGPIMASYYRLSAELPEGPVKGESLDRPMTWLPLTWDRAYAAPSHWRHLVQDSHSWGAEIEDETYAAALPKMKLDRSELHRRLERRWRIGAKLNRQGEALVEQALAASPRSEARTDLEFLRRLLGAYQPLTEALAEYHACLYARFTPGQPRANFTRAATLAETAERQARIAFPNPVDPVGGEIGTLRALTVRLKKAIQDMDLKP
jgi:Glycosyl hydrolase family 20, domain 2